jgi:hypothetical protein
MFRRKIIRNQEAYPENQYFDARMSPEDIQRVIDEEYMALVRKRESNQPLTKEELIKFESLSTKVSPNLARAYAMGGYALRVDGEEVTDGGDTTENLSILEGVDQPGYGGYFGPGLPEGLDDDQDGLPNFNDSNPNMQGGNLVNLSTNPVGGASAQNYSNTTTNNASTDFIPFVPDTTGGMPGIQNFNPYQNVGFGLATALTSDDSGERKAGRVLTGLAGASSVLDFTGGALSGLGTRKQILNNREAMDEAASLDMMAPIESSSSARGAGYLGTGRLAQDGLAMYKKGGKTKKKNKPNDPALWSRAIAAAKNKFDVYPSAYANAWAVQWYKKKGGTWRKAQDGFMFEEGGKITIEEQLSGRHVTGIARPALSGTEINAELEKNEYVEYPEEQKISKVIGKSHARGGEKMNLKEGTRILSDNIKVGKEYRDALVDLFDMKNIKPNDTVAKVMEKYLKNSGITDIQKEQEKYLKGLKKNISVKDEDTRRVNEQFFADKIIKTQSELNEKHNEQTAVFDILFQMQETRKNKNENGDPSAKNIRVRPPLEQEYVPYEGPEPVATQTPQPVEVVMENGGTIDILMDGSKIYATPEAIEILRADALNSGYATLNDYAIENIIGYKDGGGIPERYKKKGFTKVGVKKRAPSGAKHKWEVLARKKVGGKTRYKIVKGGFRGMKDFTQHKDRKRQKSFWDRMGGKNSAKAKDPFSPLYWHKRFGTWEEGGKLEESFTPHWMYDEDNPNVAKFAEVKKDHEQYAKEGMVHDKPDISQFEQGGYYNLQDAQQSDSGVEIITDSQGNEFTFAFNDRVSGEPVYKDVNGNLFVPRTQTTTGSYSSESRGIYEAGKYGIDELDDVGRKRLIETSSSTANYVLDQFNKLGNLDGLTVNVFGASSNTPVSPARQRKIFQDLGYEQIGSNKNRYRVPDLVNDPTGQTFMEVTINAGAGVSSDIANYGLPKLRVKDQVTKLKEDLLAAGVPQEQIDLIKFESTERPMIGPEYGGEGVKSDDPKYMPFQNSGYSVEMNQESEKFTPYSYETEEDTDMDMDFSNMDLFMSDIGSARPPALTIPSQLASVATNLATTPLLTQQVPDIDLIKVSPEEALRENAGAANMVIRQNANRGGADARTLDILAQTGRSQASNQATAEANAKNAEIKLKTQAQRATLQTNIDNAVNNRITNYTTNALTAEDNELSRVNAFIKAKQERADQQVRTANNLAMMSELADNFNVSPQGVTYIPGSDYIFYPGNMNTGQQYLYSAASPTTTD